MRVGTGLLVALALVAGEARADVDVQYKGGLVDVRATAAPLAEVLDRLSRTTGMKVVQQGVTPSMLLSLSLLGRTPAEAVFGVLEGLGLNYAFVLDASGNRIETLVLAGTAGGRSGTPTSTAPALPPVQRFVPHPSNPPPAAGPDDAEEATEEEAAEDADAGEEPEAPAVRPGAGGANPGPRGSVLQTPAEPAFPSSPFAPRAPVFTPQPEPPPQAQPTPAPKPPDRNP